MSLDIKLYKDDLPNDLTFFGSVAVDTETLGLNYKRDRLCLIQISAGDNVCHMVKFDEKKYNCPNLKKLLTDKNVLKIMQYARFDIAMIKEYLNVECTPVYCTKIASKIARTNVIEHGLSSLCRDLLGITISKEETSSDWGALELSEKQLNYAALDVLYLHKIKEKIDFLLKREGRYELAHKCFDFLNTRAELDLNGWLDIDIFSHK